MIDWRELAACRGRTRPATFLPEDTGDSKRTHAQHLTAKRFCVGCPVTEDCLEYALANDELWGVWGNTTPRERRTIRESRQRSRVNA